MKTLLVFIQLILLSTMLWLFLVAWVNKAYKPYFECEPDDLPRNSQVKRFRTKLDRFDFMNQWLKTYQRWLMSAGKKRDEAEKSALIWLSVQCLGTVLIGISQGVVKAGMYFVLIGFVLMVVTKLVSRDREAAVNMAVYKVYRYMHLQNAAGLSAIETLKHMHESTELHSLKEGLKAYSNTYFKTMDTEKSERAMFEHIQGQSASILAATFKQGIELGQFIELVKRQEEMMLKAFYRGLEVKGQALHVKSVAVACAMCLLIFLMLLMPMLYEMQRATDAIFSL